MRTALVTVFTVLLLAVAALIIGPSFVDWSQYKGQAETQIKKITGYDTEIKGDLSLALIPAPRLSAEEVTVKSGVEKLVSLQRLDVNLELAPLFSKNIVVKSVDLVKPDITIAVLENGKQNWMSPEIEALMAKKQGGEVQDQGEAQAEKSGDLAGAVSLESVSIEDGRFSFKGAPSKPATVIEKINLDIAAETLKGPFTAEGALSFGGKPVELEVKAGELKSGAESISLNAKGKYAGANFQYAGVVGLKAPFEAQGETALSVDSLAGFLKENGVKNPPVGNESASFKGVITGSSEKVVAKNAALSLMGLRFSGDVSATLSPMNINIDLTGQDTINLDEILPKGSGGAAKSAGAKGGGSGAPANGLATLGDMLPKSLSMPAGLNAQLRLSVPAALYQGQTYQKVSAVLSKQGQSLKASIKAQAPGKADIEADTVLSYASKSKSEKAGTDVFADPSLSVNLKASAPNVAETAQTLTGKNDLPYISTAKTGQFDIAATVTPGALTLSPSTVRLDEDVYKLSGSLKGSDLIANIEALGGQLIVKGALGSDMQLSNMAVQMKHPSLPQAVKTLSKAPAVNPMLTGPVDFYTEVQQNGSAYTLSNIKAKIMNTAMSGDLRYDGASGKPDISGALAFGDLVIPSAGTSPAAKAAAGKNAAGGGAGGGQWSSKPIDTGFLYSANADLDIKADSIKFEKWDVTKPALKFKLSEGALKISQLDAGLFGGQLGLNADITGPKSGPLSVQSKAKLDNVQIERLVDALAGNKLVKGKGLVSLDTQISTSGASQAAMIRALGGQGTLSGSGIVLEGFDLTRFARAMSEDLKPGDSLLNIWKGTTSGGSTSFDTLDGAYAINSGIVKIQKLDLDGPTASIGTTGHINLPNWTIATAHLITVKNRTDVPPFTVNIAGPLNNPGQTFAQGALQDYFSRKLNRKLEKVLSDKIGGGDPNDPLNKLLGGVLGGGTTQQQPQQAAPQDSAPAAGSEQQQPAQQQQQTTPTPEEALEGVLKGLFQ